MADFSSLKNQILDDIKQNKTVATSQQRINAQLKNGTANYKSAADFSKALGSAVGDSFKKNVTDVANEELGQFARDVVAPVYSQEQKTMLSVCSKVQKQVNADADLDINPVEIKQDVSRIQHIIQRFEEASSFDEVSFLIGKNVAQSIARGAVNDSIEDNIDFQEDAGLQTLIVRTDGGGCCDWCASLCGEFHSREELPEDFWRVHRNCSCVIDYRVGKTKDKIKYITNKNGSLSKSNK